MSVAHLPRKYSQKGEREADEQLYTNNLQVERAGSTAVVFSPLTVKLPFSESKMCS